MALSPNAKKIGDYLVEMKKLLGTGSYGQVFLGEHIRTGRKVAAKLLEADKLYVTEDTDLEARAMMALPDHENVLKIHDFIKKEVIMTEQKVYINFWLMLELCPLGSLVDYAVQKSMVLTDKVDLMLQGNHGLLHLHGLRPKAFIHRDIKPSNMLIAGGSDKVVLKLGDFGEVKIIESSLLMSSMRGTQSYWAPEMFSLIESNTKLSYDKSVDIYAKGMSDLALLDCGDKQKMVAKSENGKELGLYLYQNRNQAVKIDIENRTDSADVKEIKKLIALMIAQDASDRPSIQEVVPALNYMLIELRAKYQHREARPSLLKTIASDDSDSEKQIRAPGEELQRRNLEFADVKPTAKFSDPKLTAKIVDTKPTAKADDAKPTAEVSNPEPTANIVDAKPTAKAEDAKPTAIVCDPEPTATIVDAKPTAKADDAKPTAKVSDPKPTTNIVDAKPTVKADDSKPTAKVSDPKPTATIVDAKPTAKPDDAKPTIKVSDPKPTAKIVDAKPTAKAEDAKPTIKVSDPKPIAKIVDAKPTTKADNAKPIAKVSDPEPTATIVDAKPTAKANDAKPTAKVSDPKPTTNIVDAKPKTKADDAQPNAKVSDPKPTAKIVDAKPTAKPDDAKPTAKVFDPKPTTNIVDAKPTAVVADAKPTTRFTEKCKKDKLQEIGELKETLVEVTDWWQPDATPQSSSIKSPTANIADGKPITEVASIKPIAKVGDAKPTTTVTDVKPTAPPRKKKTTRKDFPSKNEAEKLRPSQAGATAQPPLGSAHGPLAGASCAVHHADPVPIHEVTDRLTGLDVKHVSRDVLLAVDTGMRGLWIMENDQWVNFPIPAKIPHYGVCFSSLHNGLVAMGGTNDFTINSAKCYFFSLDTKQWTELPDMITPRSYGSALEFQENLIMVVGGGDNKNKYSAVCEILDMNQGKWISVVSMAEPLFHPLVAALDGLVYILTLDAEKGLGTRKYARVLQKLNSVKNEITQKAPQTHSVESVALGLVGLAGKLYFFSVDVYGSDRGQCYQYDPATNGWLVLETCYPLPYPYKGYCTTVVRDEKILLCGSYKDKTAMVEYDSTTNQAKLLHTRLPFEFDWNYCYVGTVHVRK